MSKGNAFSNEMLLLIFNAIPIAYLADNASASPVTNLYVSLHNGDVGEGGTQTTNETNYASYARVAVARSAAGWTVTDNAVDNAALVQFPSCTGGTDTITHFAVGMASSGIGTVFYKGTLASPLAVSSGVQPEFATGDIRITED